MKRTVGDSPERFVRDIAFASRDHRQGAQKTCKLFTMYKRGVSLLKSCLSLRSNACDTRSLARSLAGGTWNLLFLANSILLEAMLLDSVGINK